MRVGVGQSATALHSLPSLRRKKAAFEATFLAGSPSLLTSWESNSFSCSGFRKRRSNTQPSIFSRILSTVSWESTFIERESKQLVSQEMCRNIKEKILATKAHTQAFTHFFKAAFVRLPSVRLILQLLQMYLDDAQIFSKFGF